MQEEVDPKIVMGVMMTILIIGLFIFYFSFGGGDFTKLISSFTGLFSIGK